MTPTSQGSLRLFRVWGVTVFLHWTWFLVAMLEFNDRGGRFQSRIWHVVEYLSLFAIVLMHEFGHSLACRQVGGQANQIVLWPFGGVAYVNPPPRPGATLWSIAAGPLVNVVLLVVLTAIGLFAGAFESERRASDPIMWLFSVWVINLILLVFNMLPIYPLDGGQILRSLLWFVFGRAKSLLIATVLGFLGVVVLIVLAVFLQNLWWGILCAFILLNCWRGFQAALQLLKLEKLPVHFGFTCPNCLEAPAVGSFWVCGRCRTSFDIFATRSVCPNCAAEFTTIRCVKCGSEHPLPQWSAFTSVIRNS